MACFIEFFFLYFEVDGKIFFFKKRDFKEFKRKMLDNRKNGKIRSERTDSILSRVERNAGGILRPG